MEILVGAFYDDPVWSWAFPDPAARRYQHQRFWRLYVDGAARYRSVWLNPGKTATAVWIPPGGSELSAAQEEQLVPLLVELLGADDAPRVVHVCGAFELARPQDVEYHYLALLGTDPAHRSRGLGLALLEETLAQVGAQDGPAYLEASNPANVRLYERYGFRRRSVFTLPRGGPEVTTMWREPSPAGWLTLPHRHRTAIGPFGAYVPRRASDRRSQDAELPAVRLAVPPLDRLHERRSEKWDVDDRSLLMSTVAEMDFPLAPAVTATVHAAIDRHDVGYATSATPALRQAFAGFAARRLGWYVDPECVSLLPDVVTGVVHLARILTGENGVVAIATPAYPPFLADLPRHGLPVRTVPLAADGSIDPDVLGSVLATGVRVFVLVNPHNPTGRVLAQKELEAVAEVCAAHETWVLADEIFAPLALPGATHLPWLEVSDAARHRGIVLTSASKAFNIPALKSALLVTASQTAQDALRRLPPLAEHAGLLGILASEVAFADCDAWLDAVIARLEANRALVTRLLRERLPGIRWQPPDASYLAWLDCRALGLGDDPAHTFRERGRVALNSGLAYGDTGAGFARLNFATSPALVEEMVDRMAAATSSARTEARG